MADTHMDQMAIESWESILRKIQDSYCKLILITGEGKTGKTTLLRQLVDQFQMPQINVGEELSRKLLALELDERPRQTDALLAELIGQAGADRVALDNTEILFEPELALKPLEALKAVARSRLILATWNGRLTGTTLTFAAPGHPAHRVYPLDRHSDVLVHSTEVIKP